MIEWLTDKEKRILFSALTREKSVCIKVDKQCEPREPYEQSLQSVCESLEHKFYYDRLFKQMEKQIRAEAIDDFAEKLKSKCDGMINEEWNSNVAPMSWAEAYADFKDDIYDIAEQLKEGMKNELRQSE